jgi:hypothetical protein
MIRGFVARPVGRCPKLRGPKAQSLKPVRASAVRRSFAKAVPEAASSPPRVHLEVRVLLERGEGNQVLAALARQPFLGAAIGAR